MPLSNIESNTELVSSYRKKREVSEVLFNEQSVKGVTSNSIDSIETLSPEALLALSSLSDATETIANAEAKSKSAKSTSFFQELMEKSLSKQEKSHSIKKRYAYEPTRRIDEIFAAYEKLASDYGTENCFNFSESQRRLPGDVIYGADTQFESQSKLALSIAHFLSSFYQIINPEEDYPLRNAEKAISEDQIYAEVMAAAGTDFKAVGVGIFFDRNKFRKDKPYFGPYAFIEQDAVKQDNFKNYRMVDLTGMPGGYINEEWFQAIKSRWAVSPELAELEQFYLKPFIRGDYAGKILVHYESGFPQYYYGAKLK